MPVQWYEPSDEAVQKFDSVVSAMAGDGNVTEILIQEWKRIFWFVKGDFSSNDNEWGFDSGEIRKICLSLIAEKSDDNGVVLAAAKAWNDKGHFNFRFARSGLSLRANWSRANWKDCLQLRVIPSKAPTPAALGIPDQIRAAVSEFRKGGIVIVTAPTANGKSTTIASVLQEFFNENCVNAVTVEDPIEYEYSPGASSVRQREIGFDVDSYDTAIEAAMRQSPQVFVIQEMTTDSVVRAGMDLARRWCLVISTLHSPDVQTAFQRMLDAFPDQQKPQALQDLKNYFRCFVSQRLVPKADGTGVTAAFEVLTTSQESRGIISEGAFNQIQNVLGRPWQLSFGDEFARLAEEGTISAETALAYCPESSQRSLRKRIESA